MSTFSSIRKANSVSRDLISSRRRFVFCILPGPLASEGLACGCSFVEADVGRAAADLVVHEAVDAVLARHLELRGQLLVPSRRQRAGHAEELASHDVE